MPKILITGNGFDLNIGLPTAYNDFINILTEIEKNEPVFEEIYKCSLNSELLYKNFKSINFDSKNIKLLKENISKNLWFKFFKKEFDIESWIDFESKIEYVLNQTYKGFKIFKKFADEFNNSIPINDINKYVIFKEIEVVSVFEHFGIVIYNEFMRTHNVIIDYLLVKHDYIIGIDLTKIKEKLLQELIQFKSIFISYLKMFVFPLFENNSISFINHYSKINNHFTFNYTNTFKLLFNDNLTTEFIHGKIDELNHNFVLGIDEIENEELLKYFLPFTKYFQKLNFGTDYDFLYKFRKLEKSYYEFYFIGHSLDRSDEEYINEVFDFVKKMDKELDKIYVILRSNNSKSKLLENLLQIRGRKEITELMKGNKLIFLLNNSKELFEALNKELPKRNYGVQIS